MGYEGKALEVLCIAIVFLVLSWISIILRIWVRVGILKAVGKDDYTMGITQALFTMYLGCQLGGVVYGTGRHLKDLVPWRAERALAYWWGCEVSYVLATTMMKISIGLFLLRIAVSRTHIWIIRGAMALSAVFGAAFAMVVFFQCWPIKAFWTLDPSDGKCIDADILSALTYTISGLNLIADWTFAILPIFIVKDLQMPTRRKISVACILALAAVGSTATIVRLPSVGTLKDSSLGWNGDFLWSTVDVAIWTTVEVGLGITAGCMATLWPLVQLIRDKFGLGSSHHGTRSATPGFGPKIHIKRAPGMELDGMKPGQGIMTTITSKHHQHSGLWKSRNSSEEHLARPDNITREVVVEYDEEPRYDQGR